MMGLLLKDCYTLFKQMKFFLLLLVVFALLPGYNMAAFAIAYASFLPVTALAYDERSKWGSYAAMMPYSPVSLVWSKYLMGIFATGIATVLALLARALQATVQHTTPDSTGIVVLWVTFCAALILQNLNLPVLFFLGVERGRLVFLVLVIAAVFAINYGASTLTWSLSLLPLCMGAVLLLLLTTLLSLRVSVSIYQRKEEKSLS